MTKRESSFGMRIVLYLEGELVQDIFFFLLEGMFIDLEGYSEVFMYFLFFLLL